MEKEDFILEIKEFFEFYKKEIGKWAKKGNVIFVSFTDLAKFSYELAENLLKRPEEFIALFEIALEEMGLIKNPKVRFYDLPESSNLRISEIRSLHLNTLIAVEGIVRQASEVRPQVVNAKFECTSCGNIVSLLQVERKFREPARCPVCGRKGRAAFRLVARDMVDAQRLVIEESPEILVGGEQPRRIAVFLKEDLVEPKMEKHTTPGSRIMVIGWVKEIPIPLPSGAISTRFDLAIEANNIIPLEETYEEIEISEEEEQEIKELASDPDIYEKVAKSIAPSIFGYEDIKLGIALQLFGGVKKKKADGTESRGDIHILLVGDPGVAKSVLLKFVSSIAPKGRYVVGKAATKAGITATVVRDEFLRGWSLEAGAMVLANKGIVCIDEMEKMGEEDRSALHEAMEQQTVTISKANVQAMLRAETSVLGAANPKLGRFDPYQSIAEQINLPPTLLNRFDLIFAVRDIPEKAKDEAIATHVLLEHKKKGARMFIEKELLRKFIAYARQRCHPELTDEAIEEIKNFYVSLRNAPSVAEGIVRPIPISARQLESLIRLSEASAKVRLSREVTREDARRAIRILKLCMLQVGLDLETGAIDIDRIATGIPASERGKIILVRETIAKLESRIGKLIPVEELRRELKDKLKEETIDEIIEKLKRSGDLFEPRRGFIQRL